MGLNSSKILTGTITVNIIDDDFYTYYCNGCGEEVDINDCGFRHKGYSTNYCYDCCSKGLHEDIYARWGGKLNFEPEKWECLNSLGIEKSMYKKKEVESRKTK
jgi:hypothetical protein